jgi:hypothetical protein
MQVTVTPNYSSSGADHHIEDGYMVLNEVVRKVYKDGEEINPTTERVYEVTDIEDNSPEAIYLKS